MLADLAAPASCGRRRASVGLDAVGVDSGESAPGVPCAASDALAGGATVERRLLRVWKVQCLGVRTCLPALDASVISAIIAGNRPIGRLISQSRNWQGWLPVHMRCTKTQCKRHQLFSIVLKCGEIRRFSCGTAFAEASTADLVVLTCRRTYETNLIAACTLAALAGTVQAQSSVQLMGLADVYAGSKRMAGDARRASVVNSGGMTTSWFGVKARKTWVAGSRPTLP